MTREREVGHCRREGWKSFRPSWSIHGLRTFPFSLADWSAFLCNQIFFLLFRFFGVGEIACFLCALPTIVNARTRLLCWVRRGEFNRSCWMRRMETRGTEERKRTSSRRPRTTLPVGRIDGNDNDRNRERQRIEWLHWLEWTDLCMPWRIVAQWLSSFDRSMRRCSSTVLTRHEILVFLERKIAMLARQIDSLFNDLIDEHEE